MPRFRHKFQNWECLSFTCLWLPYQQVAGTWLLHFLSSQLNTAFLKAWKQSWTHRTRVDSCFDRAYLSSSVPQLNPDWGSIHKDLHCSKRRIRMSLKQRARIHMYPHTGFSWALWFIPCSLKSLTSPPSWASSQTSLRLLKLALETLRELQQIWFC